MKLPVPVEFKLANGMTVLLMEQHNLPVFSAEIAVLRGSDSNPAAKPGLASFTASMLTEGTDKRTSPQLADDIAQIGASLSAGSSMDATRISGGALTRNTDKLFDLLSDVALHPAFRGEEIDRVRQRRLTTLLQQADNPNDLAGRMFNRQVYGENSPYGYLEIGTKESVQGIDRGDLLDFYKAGFGPKNAALVVAGDINGSQLKSLAEKYFGGWSAAAAPSQPPTVSSTMTRHIVIVDKPKSPQSVLQIGQVGLARDNPDYVSVQVMNAILGGLFSSRINLNLREAHGYTYGAFSAFNYRRSPGPFYVSTMVRTDATAPSVKEVFAELVQMRETQVKPEELAMAREALVRGLTSIFETTGQTAATTSNLFIYRLPLDYYSSLPRKIEAVIIAEVQRVAQKYLSPDKMVIVVVGDRSAVEPELKKLDLGPLEVYDANMQSVGSKPSQSGK